MNRNPNDGGQGTSQNPRGPSRTSTVSPTGQDNAPMADRVLPYPVTWQVPGPDAGRGPPANFLPIPGQGLYLLRIAVLPVHGVSRQDKLRPFVEVTLGGQGVGIGDMVWE